MQKTAMVILLVAAAFLAGCTANPAGGEDIARDTVRAHFEHHGDWSPGLGCFEKVSGYAYTTGNSSADGVAISFNLVDTRTGTIRDSRSVFLGTLAAGQSRTFESHLDGECIGDYRVEGAFSR